MPEATKNLNEASDVILLLVIGTLVILLITMIAAFLIMVQDLEVVLNGHVMAFFEATLDETYIFEAFLLEIIN